MKLKGHLTIYRVAAMLALALVLSACRGLIGAPPAPTSSPLAARPTDAAECVTIDVPQEGGWGTTSDQDANATLIVVGEFKGYGPAKWNTPDGLRPPNAKGARDLVSARIFRPMKVKVDDTWRGDPENMVKALQGGGTVGCDTVSFTSNVVLQLGERYAFFFWPISDADGELRGSLMLSVAYPVATDGTVSRPSEPDVPLATLAEQVRMRTVPTPTPELPGEPVPTDSGPG